MISVLLLVLGVALGLVSLWFGRQAFKSDPGPLTEKEKRALLRVLDGGRKR